MAKATNYAYTSFTTKPALTLTLTPASGPALTFDLLGFTSTFNLNSIPEAVCSLPIGRNAYDGTTVAAIHNTGNALAFLMPATVTATFYGDFTPNGAGPGWPAGPQVLFKGYYTGYGYQKQRGQIQVQLHLIHWLADLGFSTALVSSLAPADSANLAFAAVQTQLKQGLQGAGATDLPAWLPADTGGALVLTTIPTDLWLAIKLLLCALAGYKALTPVCNNLPSTCVDDSSSPQYLDTLLSNSRALRALNLIEGPCTCGSTATAASSNYVYGKPIVPRVSDMAQFQMVSAITQIDTNMLFSTMWDLLVGYYLPTFGLEICPAIDRAVVQPTVPGWRGPKYWKTIAAGEYSSIDEKAMVPKPLRGVVVLGSTLTQGGTWTGPDVSECSGGAYAAPTVNTGDGTVLYEPLPIWINGAIALKSQTAQPATVTTSTPATPPASTPSSVNLQVMADAGCWARFKYIENMLQGRSADISGKLRFDIAPGSHIELEATPEQFTGGSQDTLASNKYGQVVQVTISIDAENQTAATAMRIVHLRTPQENKSAQTSIAGHPLFKDDNSVGTQGGLPLLPALDLR